MFSIEGKEEKDIVKGQVISSSDNSAIFNQTLSPIGAQLSDNKKEDSADRLMLTRIAGLDSDNYGPLLETSLSLNHIHSNERNSQEEEFYTARD